MTDKNETIEIISQFMIDKVDKVRNWYTPNKGNPGERGNGKGTCYSAVSLEKDTFKWYEGGSVSHACFSTLPDMLQKIKGRTLKGLCYWTNLVEGAERTKLHQDFFDFLSGDESPYIQFKHWLFPNGPRMVKTSLGATDIYSRDFRLAYGFAIDDLSIPTRLFVDYYKAQRMLGEHYEHIIVWQRLIDEGLTKREAFFWCQLIKMYDNKATVSFGWHKNVDSSSGWDEAFVRMALGKPNVKALKGSLDDQTDYHGCWGIWSNSNTPQSEFFRLYLGKDWMYAFPWDELVISIKKAMPLLYSKYKGLDT